MSNLLSIFRLKELRVKILFTLFIVIVYRLGSHIPIPGVDLDAVKALFQQGGLLGFFNLFSGGGMSRFSVFSLGILPFINASIIMQLLTIMYPKLKEIAEEGESGRKQLGQYTRYLAICLSFVQATVMSIGFKAFLVQDAHFGLFLFYSITALVAGAAIVMWLGEVLTEYGIGNGASILIFVGIIAQMPSYIRNTVIQVKGGTSIFGVLVMILVFLGIIISIVCVQEAQRRILVQYAKRVVGRKMYGGQNTYIPLRLIQGGVMPIIFASAMLQFPLMFSQYVDIEFIGAFFSKYYSYD